MNPHKRNGLSAAKIHTEEETSLYLCKLKENFEKEEAAFQRLAPELVAAYRGFFVALSEGRIVDRDRNELSLAKRISRSFKGKFVLIEQVIGDSISTTPKVMEAASKVASK